MKTGLRDTPRGVGASPSLVGHGRRRGGMRQLVVGALLALAVAGTGQLVAPVHASTVQGSAVTISGLDDLAATADQQARRGAGKIIAMVLGMGGLATVLSGRIGLGLAGVGAGMGMGFVPSMMSSAFDAAPAATGALVSPVTAGAWWAPLTAGLYPGLVLLRLGQDPVVLAACLVALCGVRWTRPRGVGVTSS